MDRATDRLISELKIYISLYPIPQEQSSKFVQAHNALLEAAGPFRGSYLGDATSKPDDKLILDIIRHCDDSTQEELISAFGEESIVAQLIRKTRIEKYIRGKHPRYPFDELKESLQREIKEIRKEGNPFYQGTCEYMKRLGFDKDSDFYNAIGMPRQQFARLRNAGNTLSKKTVLWIIVGLRLNYQEATDLLMKAGYSFRKSDMRDVILMYILRNTDYNLRMVNEVFEHFGLEPFC